MLMRFVYITIGSNERYPKPGYIFMHPKLYMADNPDHMGQWQSIIVSNLVFYSERLLSKPLISIKLCPVLG